MEVPDEPTTPFAAVSAQTSRLQRVRCDKEKARWSVACVSLTCRQQYQALLDRLTPFVLYRWLGTGAALFIFFLRVFLAQGWYIGQ
jgi:hypothetical protein